MMMRDETGETDDDVDREEFPREIPATVPREIRDRGVYRGVHRPQLVPPDGFPARLYAGFSESAEINGRKSRGDDGRED